MIEWRWKYLPFDGAALDMIHPFIEFNLKTKLCLPHPKAFCFDFISEISKSSDYTCVIIIPYTTVLTDDLMAFVFLSTTK